MKYLSVKELCMLCMSTHILDIIALGKISNLED